MSEPMNRNLHDRQFQGRRVAPGLYVTRDGRHAVYRNEMTKEWQVHEHEGHGKTGFGGLGEWHGTHQYKDDAVYTANQCDMCGKRSD